MNAIYKHLSDKFLLSAVLGVSLLIASSCVKTLDEQAIPLAGKWAKVDGAFMTSEYVEFRSGNMKSFVSESRKLIYDGTVWNSSQNDFDNKGNERYSVYDGTLIVAGKELGKLSIDKDTMTVGNTRYINIDDFKSEQYSRIEIKAEEPVKCGYAGGLYSFRYEIDNPLEWNSISASSDADWITSVKCESGVVSFTAKSHPRKEQRSGFILLSYPNADDVSVPVLQKNFRFLYLDKEYLTADYKSGEREIYYTIDNPTDEGFITYSTESSWIRNITVGTRQIFIILEENNTGLDRTCTVLFSYPDADDVKLTVTQSYSAPEILVVPERINCDYTRGSFSFSYRVENPREGEVLQVSTESDWIKDLKQTDNTISFTVPENNTGLSRKGIILLKYGDYIQEYSVSQSYSAPEIIATPEVINCDYTGGPFSFSYRVENPREEADLQVICSDAWITDIAVSSDRISFSVSENPTFHSRQSKLLLNHANVEKEVSVLQKMKYNNLIDLSSSGTANCYIVSSAGGYKFPAVKGNSNESVGRVSSVEVLWESFGTNVAPLVGDLISDVSYSNNMVYFMTSGTFLKGNAVISAKNASGKILWSWHIWLTDQPEDHVYNNGAGTIMDRNLGATSATPGSVGALGLLYQWGRKDPFLGSSSILSSTRAKSTFTWPSPVESTSSTGRIDYAVSNPATFITYNDSNYDWYYNGSSSTDNERWQSSKTIYDPCPPGYRVPDGGDNGIWSKAFGSSSSFDSDAYDNSKKGFNFGLSGKGTQKLSNSVNTCWYPHTGSLDCNDGSLSGRSGGYVWSCSPDGDNAYYLYFGSIGSVRPSGSNYRAYGCSVRCLKE